MSCQSAPGYEYDGPEIMAGEKIQVWEGVLHTHTIYTLTSAKKISHP
ncbi:unnamed protein product, partial [Staurois parvus]